MSTIVIEADTETNGNLYFPPLMRTIRGRFDFLRVKEKMARMTEWPVIPGQLLHVNTATGAMHVEDPLHEKDHAEARKRILARGQTLPPAREDITGVDVPTMLFWMHNAVQSKAAKVISGTFPDKLPGKPKTRFHSQEDLPGGADELARLRAEVAELRALVKK